MDDLTWAAPSTFESPESSLTSFTAALPDWYADAACLDADPEAFFPDKGGTTTPAVAICETCQVRSDCLDYALTLEAEDTGLCHGVWGGHTPKERRRMERLVG